MAVKKYKPTTPGQRGMTGYTFEEITKSTPERSLTVSVGRHGGRNSYGRVTVRHRGGGNRRLVRVVDFKREKFDIPAKVAAIEYDPNRTARLALLHYADGEKRYILAPLDLKVGDTLISGPNAEIRTGNYLPISHIPVGTLIHNIELKFEELKTKVMAATLNSLVGESSALVLMPTKDASYDNVTRAGNNIPDAKILLASYVNIRDLLGYQKVVMPLQTLDILSAQLGKE